MATLKNAGIVIQARMSSTRLAGKVLADLNGKPMLARQLERLALSKRAKGVLLATSTEASDDPIAEFCRTQGVAHYRGRLDDVLDRYYQAAVTAKFDPIVRITADCPLIDPAVIDTMLDLFAEKDLDYLANTAPPEGSTFPDGMDVEIFSFAALEQAWKEAKKPSDREHVTFYFWKNPELFRTFRHDLVGENLSSYRLTVDYPADLELVRAVHADLTRVRPDFTLRDVIEHLRRNPRLLDKNAGIQANQGWQSALEKDKAWEKESNG